MKALIITYYWPPAGGPGVQRWLKFVKYLKEFDIEPIVYAPKNPTYPLEDDSLLTEILDDITAIKRPIFEPYRFAEIFSKKETKTISKGIISGKEKQSLVQRILLYIRGNFFIPDARKFWVNPSVKYLKKYISEHKIETIITTGPPHSVHLIGKKLKAQMKLNWVADFRDPWTTIGYHDKLKLTTKSLLKHKELEKEVLGNADHIIVTSFTTKEEFQNITNRPISIITNGYDFEDVEEVSLDQKFTISHIGSLLSGRNPENLWRALAELVESDKEFAEWFRLKLVGTVSQDVLKTLHQYGLSQFLELVDYVPHSEAVTIQKRSQVLLLIEINSNETKCIIPGKLFEYMVSKRPILAVGPENADISRIISETNSGSFFTYKDCESIKLLLKEYFEQYKEQKLVSRVTGIEKYSRRELTRSLAEILKNIKQEL
ncbi:glycosyltransferase family 4 protein [Aquimarina mytili]|uniref:glycosyltransferase family 4 protein n=1 Tax=Aquimarina mytili TaxID=874423 RepID=UPI001F29B68E|nr:glycosyltransferase family 4 protein [Aquimarina mytili]